MRAAAGWVAERLSARGPARTSRSPRPAAIPPCWPNGWAHRSGRPRSWSTATTTCSRPIRWRLWIHPALRADHPRRPALCARRRRRQGAGVIPILVAEAFLRAEGRLPVNMKFLFEGEEEVGSAHLPRSSRANAERLRGRCVAVRGRGHVACRHADDHRRQPRASARSSSACMAPPRICIPAAMAAARRTRCMPSHRWSPACTMPTAG